MSSWTTSCSLCNFRCKNKDELQRHLEGSEEHLENGRLGITNVKTVCKKSDYPINVSRSSDTIHIETPSLDDLVKETNLFELQKDGEALLSDLLNDARKQAVSMAISKTKPAGALPSKLTSKQNSSSTLNSQSPSHFSLPVPGNAMLSMSKSLSQVVHVSTAASSHSLSTYRLQKAQPLYKPDIFKSTQQILPSTTNVTTTQAPVLSTGTLRKNEKNTTRKRKADNSPCKKADPSPAGKAGGSPSKMSNGSDGTCLEPGLNQQSILTLVNAVRESNQSVLNAIKGQTDTIKDIEKAMRQSLDELKKFNCDPSKTPNITQSH